MQEVYVREGKRYRKIGYSGTPDLFDGIWCVQNVQHGQSSKNVLMRLSRLATEDEIVDLLELSSSIQLEERLITILRDIFEKPGRDNFPRMYNISLADAAERIANGLYKSRKNINMRR